MLMDMVIEGDDTLLFETDWKFIFRCSPFGNRNQEKCYYSTDSLFCNMQDYNKMKKVDIKVECK